MPDNFTQIEFTKSNLDRFYVRSSILKALHENLPLFSGTLLDIGCGKMPYRELIMKKSSVKEYFGLDLENAIYDADLKPDFFWNGKIIPFGSGTIDTVLATEVLEHCTEPSEVLREIHRVLKPGAILFFTVPYLWTLHEVPNDEFRYTPFSMQRLLRQAGFSQISIKSLGGWNASLAQMLGLWVRRSSMSKRKRKLLSALLKPVISRLIKSDAINHSFSEGQMITGFYGIVTR